ncbi:MAG: helix-turn-helix transcriptional regulator [Leadbetterella sp.]|jgi:DNA-binding HxlR family transcriptional regulator|nr:helix-turn-helix transcriptional regulator [Leadbetterella sp.]
MKFFEKLENITKCPVSYVLALQDTLNAFHGKWKMPIIGTLLFGKKRFKEIEREVRKITPRMLSQELKDLEVNGIVTRTVYNTTPVTVEYELTPSGRELHLVMESMITWGLQHRQTNIMENLPALNMPKQRALEI